MEARQWNIVIPIRPKAVQSTRGDRGHFHVDPKVRKWKESILPYIKASAPDVPSDLPIWVRRIRYVYKVPQSADKQALKYIEAGGEIPYMVAGDLTDNLSKGLIDCCAGLIFTDDKNIVRVDNARKIYGLSDRIEITFEEIPGIMLIDGTMSGGISDPGSFI